MGLVPEIKYLVSCILYLVMHAFIMGKLEIFSTQVNDVKTYIDLQLGYEINLML